MRYLTGWGNVRCGMHLLRQISVGHLSGRGNVRRGCVWSGKCPSGMCLVGEMSVGEASAGEESVGQMSVGDVSGNSKIHVWSVTYESSIMSVFIVFCMPRCFSKFQQKLMIFRRAHTSRICF